MSSQRFKVASGTVANAVQMALGLLTTVLFSRILGPDVIGIYFFVLAVVSTSDGLINGMISACRKRIPEAESNVAELLGVLVYGVIPFTVVFSLGVTSVLFVSGATDVRTSVLIFVAFTPFVASTAGVRAIIGFERVDLGRWLQTARTVIRVLIQFALLGAGMGIVGMVIGHAVAMGLAAVAAFTILGILPRFPSGETTRSVWEFARYSIPGGIVSRIDESADEMFMGLLFAAGAVGDYGVAVRLVAPALLIPGVIQGSLSARLSRLESQGRAVDRVLRSNLAFSAVFSIPIFFGALAIGGHVIVTIFGSEYSGATAFVAILAASRVVKSWASPMTSAIAGLDRPRVVLILNTISAGAMLTAGLAAAVLMGPVGIAVGILVALLVRWGAGVLVLLDYADIRDLVPMQIGEQLAAGIVMYVVVAWLETWFITDWLAVFLTVGIGGGVYVVALLAISSETRSMVFEMTNRTGA